MNPLHLNSGLLMMDNSSLTDCVSCPRKACYKHLQRRQLVKNRAALFFGGAIHSALEVRALNCTGLVDNTCRALMIDRLAEIYADVDMDGDYRNLEYAINTIDKYNEVYRFDPMPPITLPDGRPAVELPFAIPVGSVSVNSTIAIIDPDENNGEPFETYIEKLPVVFTGKIDRITNHQNEMLLLDHKTSSMGGPTFFDEFYISLQFKGYKWAAEQLVGSPINGVVIDGIICRPPLKSGSVNHTFDRQTIYIADECVQEWQTSFMLSVQEWVNQVTRQSDFDSDHAQAFPMRTGQCVTKYGKCEYFDVCMLPPNQRETMLHSGLYEEHFWSPLEDNAKPKKREAVDFGNMFDHL